LHIKSHSLKKGRLESWLVTSLFFYCNLAISPSRLWLVYVIDCKIESYLILIASPEFWDNSISCWYYLSNCSLSFISILSLSLGKLGFSLLESFSFDLANTDWTFCFSLPLFWLLFFSRYSELTVNPSSLILSLSLTVSQARVFWLVFDSFCFWICYKLRIMNCRFFIIELLLFQRSLSKFECLSFLQKP